ncbi:NAD(P)-dependent oxidoreductase [Ekhidna sp. To15]|uniref:NAD(P)-dependent oxidoreductase n=1 Tax=Ekhidna sp. To15 TaxID=3395267 RepID=UPI003F523D00
MNLLILGATGRTGKLVLKYALENDYRVTCLSRNSKRIKKQEGLTILEGNPSKREDLRKALAGCDAVISVLNISRKSDFPWSSIRTPKKFLSDTMRQLIPFAEEEEIKRLVICSAWGVAETKENLPGWFRWFVENSNIGVAYADHERQEKVVQESNVDWTIVRPVGLTNSKRKQPVRETFDNYPKPGLLISRLAVAKYLVNSLKSIDLIGKKVVISKD